MDELCEALEIWCEVMMREIAKRNHSCGEVQWTGLLRGLKTYNDRVNGRHNRGRHRP